MGLTKNLLTTFFKFLPNSDLSKFRKEAKKLWLIKAQSIFLPHTFDHDTNQRGTIERKKKRGNKSQLTSVHESERHRPSQ